MMAQDNHRGGDRQCDAGHEDENGNNLGGQKPPVGGEGLADHLTRLWEILVHKCGVGWRPKKTQHNAVAFARAGRPCRG